MKKRSGLPCGKAGEVAGIWGSGIGGRPMETNEEYEDMQKSALMLLQDLDSFPGEFVKDTPPI
jgi:hypothetical protein